MKRLIFGKNTAIVLMVLLVLGVAMTADAQRRQSMMDRQQTQDDPWAGRGPGMMGPGTGMMGPGIGMMGGRGMPCPIMNQMGYGMGMGAPLHLPDLTEDQQIEIRSMQRKMRRDNMENMLDIMDIRDDLMVEMATERPDPGKIREMQATMSQKQGEMLESTVENRNRIYDLLTEEQQELIRDYQRRPADRSQGRYWD